MYRIVELGQVIEQRKEFVIIDDSVEYKRCRVKSHRKGVVLRDEVKGLAINTKKQQICKTNDFLVAEIDAKVGGYGFVPEELDGAIVSSHYFLFELNTKKILQEYLQWLIQTNIIQNQINSKGSTNYAAIRPKDVLSFKIPLPDIGEQKRLINRINSVSESFDLLSSEIHSQFTNIQLLRQTILQEAVQGKLVPQNSNDEPATELLKKIQAEKEQLVKQGKIKKPKPLPPISEDEIPYDLPRGWVWSRLEESTLYIQRGKSPKYSIKSEFPVISQKCIKNGYIDLGHAKYVTEDSLNSYAKERLLIDGDILWNSTGDGTIGRLAVYRNKHGLKMPIVDSHVTVVRCSKKINSEYIFYYLCSPIVQTNLEVSGSTKQVELNTTTVKKQIVALPPHQEQQRIVAKVEQLLQLCDSLEAHVLQSKTDAEKLLQAVLREAFEGKAASKVMPLSIPENKKPFAKQVLSGKIIQLFRDDRHFTHIKFQKLQFLAEHFGGADLNLNYYFQAAGPYDPNYMHTLPNKMKQNKWFAEENYQFMPLEKVNDIDKYYAGYFAPIEDKLSHVFTLLEKATEAQCEIVATLYAVWNNRLIKHEVVTDDLLVADFYAWSSRKEQYSEDRIRTAITWMNVHNIIPTGFGKEIKRAKNKK